MPPRQNPAGAHRSLRESTTRRCGTHLLRRTGTAQGNRFYLGRTISVTPVVASISIRAGLQSILSHSISDEELERAVEGIDAGQLLLVLMPATPDRLW